MAAATMPNLMENLASNNLTQANKGLQAAGLTPVGNGAGTQTPGPSSITSIMQPQPTATPASPITTPVVSTNPGAASPTAQPAAPSGVIPGTPIIAPVNGAPIVGGNGVVIGSGSGGVTGSVNTTGQTDTLNQLQNQYGAGIGSTIASTLENLGSNNSSYIQAYEQSLAQPTAENIATLNTTLGNEGAGGNSSATAIADADYMSGVTAQEGLQEQQLLQSDTAEDVGLLGSLEGVANKNQSTSVVGDIGDVFSTIAGMF